MIKKILFGFALIASMASCTDDYTDWGQPQTNPQEDAVAFGDGSVASVGVIDFANIPETQEMVQVCAITAPSASDEAFSKAIYQLNIGSASYDLTANGEMTTADFKKYVEDNFGKAPVEREMKATVEQWISNGASTVKTATSSEFSIKAKLTAPDISEHYYIIGQPSEWNPTCTALPFNHSSQNVYDDPIFTVMFDASCVNDEGDIWFAITDDKTVESNDWSMVFGAKEGDGNNNLGETGLIARRNELTDDGSFKVTPGDAKKVKVTLNMMDGTYLVELINFQEFFYEIGNDSGWGTTNPLYGANFDGKYQGYYFLNGEFKFKPQEGTADWSGDYEYDGEGKIADNGGSNCPAPETGFYQIDVDLAAGTYALTQVKSITCVGNHNGWNQADAAQHMTFNEELRCWEITTELTNGFKFVMNDDWAISWGGANDDPAAYDNLTQNGGKDLNVPEGDGTYKVQLYLSYEGNNKVVLEKQ